jgi:hypothetical protein
MLTLLLLLPAVFGDIFLHNPRGSNNKFSDDNENIANQERLFKSRNPNKGGYNSPASRDASMKYFVGSVLPIEWTINQGCGSNSVGGGPSSVRCNIVLQYMCSDALRDGNTDNSVKYNDEGESAMMKTDSGVGYMYGMHENYEYWYSCSKRQRNMGLFAGDRVINGMTSRYTRQNPTGNDYGYECPEERDYYPYWSPTPWRDIAIITDDTAQCDYFQSESQNVKAKGYCEGDPAKSSENDCSSWKTVQPWTKSKAHMKEPECLEAPWVKDNMLSNTQTGYPMMFNWTIPDEGFASCAVRVRYNVSMGDWDTWNGMDSSLNGDKSPITTDPTKSNVKCCSDDTTDGFCDCGLFLYAGWAPSTVFQDRSHRFQILPRPAGIKNMIHNLNVRGKRGNIVQTYPAVEHDFVPNILHCRVGEWIHPQWTGSDNNRNNVAGEGTEQTDRSNIVQIETGKHNYPIDWQSQTLFKGTDAINAAYLGLVEKEASACKTWAELLAINNENEMEEDGKNCPKLNPPSARYHDVGLVPCPEEGVYYYMSTRENNFSNRSQKGAIVSHPCPAGNANCSNPDVRPVNANGEWDPYDSVAGDASTLSAAPAVAAALVARQFI